MLDAETGLFALNIKNLAEKAVENLTGKTNARHIHEHTAAFARRRAFDIAQRIPE
jgi:hypothetical protein